MKRTLAICAALVAFSAGYRLINSQLQNGRFADIPIRADPCDPCALITEPDDGTARLIAAIDQARGSLDLVIYELSDGGIEEALAAAAARGVAVRVLMNGGYRGDDSYATGINGPAADYMRAHGVPIRWTPAYFDLTHEKALIIDGERAYILTFNLVSKYYATGRDFGLMDENANDVAQIEDTFDADWNGDRKDNASLKNSDLVWSPGARAALLALINRAQKSLDLYNEEMSDPGIIKTLEDAALRGIAVRVLMTYSSEWKSALWELAASGVSVRTYDAAAPLYIHAKAIVADAGSPTGLVFLGSENFSAASLDRNRELGILISNQAVLHALAKIFDSDWSGGMPLGK